MEQFQFQNIAKQIRIQNYYECCLSKIYNGYILIDSLSLELITLFSLKFNFLIAIQVFHRQINQMNFLAT